MSVAELPIPEVVTPPPRAARRPDPYDDPPPDVLFEVVNGERVEKPIGVFEQYLAGILYFRLGEFCQANPIGRALVETTFAIPGRGNDRKPDVAFVSYQTWPKSRPIPRVNAWPVAPDLAVEVVSPTDRMLDVFDKMHEYFRGGVKAVWLVLPNVDQVHCYTSPTAVRIFARTDDLTADPLFSGFRLPLSDLFPEPSDASTP